MSLTPEILQEFEDNLALFWECVLERVQELLPDLSPEEQEITPILMSESFYATCLFKATQAFYFPGHPTGYGCYYKCGVSLNNGIINIGGIEYIGNDTTAWQEVDINTVTQNVTTYPPRVEKTVDGQLVARIGSDIVLSVYDGSYNNQGVEFYSGMPGSSQGVKNHSSFAVKYGALEYTVNSQGVVTTTGEQSAFLIPMGSNFYGLCAIKGHPFIGNSKDITNINDFITKNNTTNNYNTTYTTPDNKTITVYYGDNYIITHVNDDEPVSYDDLKNVFNIAINQINDDNNTDIPDSPDYPVPPPPPGPITDDDYIDMGLGVETDGMAMYNMAVITRDDLIQLITDFEANADTGLSFIPHVLGLYKLGIESSQLLTTEVQKIKLHKEPNGTSAFTSADDYSIVKDQLTVIDCGSITIDREELLTNTFYDYSPYSTYEMFIPGCGWITLPDTVVGRTISVSIVFDLTTCSCKGIVRSEGQLLGGSGTTIATVNGIIGSSVPLSINETGLQRAAIFNGSTQAAMALGTAFLGVGIGNPYMGASGVAMAAGALADNHVAGNTTYTNTKGGATDYSVFGDGYKAVLKITRPVVEIPENYGHTVGFVVNEYGLLGDFHGFTVCVNPHIHISATSDEKEEIKRLLESGVILPDGE